MELQWVDEVSFYEVQGIQNSSLPDFYLGLARTPYGSWNEDILNF